MAGAISQPRQSCQFPFLLDEKSTVVPVRLAGEQSGGKRKVSCGDARSNSERAAPSASVGRRFSASQIVWNRSTRRAGARGGPRVGRPRWARILTITGGSSMPETCRRGGDNLRGTAAVGTVFHVDVEDAFEQPGPADARRRALPVSVLAWELGGDAGARTTLLRNFAFGASTPWKRHCPKPVERDQMETRAGHQGRQALHEPQRLHDDMSGAVFVRTLQLQHDLAGAIAFEPFVGDGRPSDIAAELLQFQTLIGAPAQRRMEAKAVRVDTQLWRGDPGSLKARVETSRAHGYAGNDGAGCVMDYASNTAARNSCLADAGEAGQIEARMKIRK